MFIDSFKEKKPSSKSSASNSHICHAYFAESTIILQALPASNPAWPCPPQVMWGHIFLQFLITQKQPVESLLGVTGCLVTTCVIQQTFSWPACETKQAAFWPGKKKGHPSFPDLPICFSLSFHHRQATCFSWNSPLMRTQEKYSKWVSLEKHQFLYF